jgi:TcpE family
VTNQAVYALPTYTEVWRVERELTHWYEYQFPWPIKVRQLVIFGVLFTAWFLLLDRVLNVPFEPGLLMILYLLPPGVGAHYAIQPFAEGKRPHEFLGSYATYFAEPRELEQLAGLPQAAEPEQVTVTAVVWRPDETVQATAQQLRTSLELRRPSRAARWQPPGAHRAGALGLRWLLRSGLLEPRRRPAGRHETRRS